MSFVHNCECDECLQIRKALHAAQEVFNILQCYSTGVSVMAEEDVVTKFHEYSELSDGLIMTPHQKDLKAFVAATKTRSLKNSDNT